MYLLHKNLVVIGYIEMKISILISILTWIPWTKLNSSRRSSILQDFLNQEYRFTFLKSQIRLAEKREDEEKEGQRQLQSVLCLTQAKKCGQYSCNFTKVGLRSLFPEIFLCLHYCCIWVGFCCGQQTLDWDCANVCKSVPFRKTSTKTLVVEPLVEK